MVERGSGRTIPLATRNRGLSGMNLWGSSVEKRKTDLKMRTRQGATAPTVPKLERLLVLAMTSSTLVLRYMRQRPPMQLVEPSLSIYPLTVASRNTYKLCCPYTMMRYTWT